MALDSRPDWHLLASFLLCLLCQLTCKHAYCQLSVNMTAFEPNLPIQHAVVNKATGDVYVGGKNFIYHLTANLSLIAEQSSNTADVTNFCLSGETRCTLPPGWDNNENKVLLIDYDNNFLVACGSAFNGTCVLHRLNAINMVEMRVHDTENYEEDSLGIGESVVAYIGDTITKEQGVVAMTKGIFVGMSFNPLFNGTMVRQHAVSTKRLLRKNNRWTFDLAFQELDFGRFTYMDLREEFVQSYPVKYVSGFRAGDFSYFVTVQKVDVDREEFETRVVRICNGDKGYYSYTEMPLRCMSRGRTQVYNLLQAAHFGTVGPKLARDLNIRADDRALFGIFSKSSEATGDTPTGHSALCIFSLKKLNRKFTAGVQQCFYNFGNQGLRQFSDNHPCVYATYRIIHEDFCGTGDLNPIQAQMTHKAIDYLHGGGHGHHYTSIAAVPIGADTIVVMGTKSGHIHKYVIEPLSYDYEHRTFALNPYKHIKLDTAGPVLQDMPFDLTEDHVYAMTPHKVYKIALKTCDHYTHCSDCVTSKDPNQCGWCGGVCTTREECEDSEEASGALPDDEVDSEDGPEWVTDACSPVIYEVSPVFGPLQGGTTIYIIGDSLTTGNLAINATLNVTIAGQPCDVMSNASSVSVIVCITPPVETVIQGPVIVEVNVEDPNLSFAIGGVASSAPKFIYSYVDPMFVNFTPMAGPIFGGTIITIRGQGLQAGNTQTVTVAGVPCHVNRVAAMQMHCTTGNTSEPITGLVVVSQDSVQLTHELRFEYKEDPYVTSYTPDKSYLSGAVSLKISGFNLHLGQSILVQVSILSETGHIRAVETEECSLSQLTSDNNIPHIIDDALTCPTPDLSNLGLYPTRDNPIETNLMITFHKHSLRPMTEDGQIELSGWRLFYYPDPILNEFEDKVLQLDPNDNIIVIHGEYLDLVSDKDHISVTVGSQPCSIVDLESTFISCQVPATLQEASDGSGIYEVEVTMGGKQQYNVGLLQVTPPEKSTQAPVAGTIIGILALVAVVLIVAGISISRYRKSRGEATQSIDNTHVGFNAIDAAGEVHLQAQGMRVNTYMANPGFQFSGAMPLMQRPLLEQINNELAAEISQVLIHEENLGVGKVLGQGHFGCVYAGNLTQDGVDRHVAVKSLHQGSLNDISSFLREGIMMKDFKHRNVLTLIGVSISSDTNMPYVVLPFMENGDILSYVRDPDNELTARQLLEFCRQIAEGMQYLSSLKFVHRDLAARNCMLDGDLFVKVADFGLSRDIYERDYYSAKDRSAKLPVRWMALECLERNIYNTKTDVWSFGVVMWELLTRGIIPYPSVDNMDILKFLHGGRRLIQPDHCPDHVYEVMLSCWSVSPIDRPSFANLVENLDGILAVKHHDPIELEQTVVYVNVPGASSS